MEFFKFDKEVRDVRTGEIVAKNVFKFDQPSSFYVTCDLLKELDRNMCRFENVSLYRCFGGCKLLESIYFPAGFNTSNVTDVSKMFRGCHSLINIWCEYKNYDDIERILKGIPCEVRIYFKFKDQEINNFIKEIQYNFRIRDIKHEDCKYIRLEFRDKNAKMVTNESICLKNIDKYYANISFENMFSGCSNLNSLDLSTFNTSNVTNMRCMFDGCKSLKNLDLSTFSTNNVADMSEMFSECKSLTIHGVSISNIGYVKSMIEELIDARSVNTISLELTELEYEGHGNHR